MAINENNPPQSANDDNASGEESFELKNVLPLLSKRNGDVNSIDENGQTILHVYLANNESDYRFYADDTESRVFSIVKSLIEKGVSVDAVDKQGKTPLHIAAEFDKLEIVQLILDSSSNIDVCDEEGNTLLHAVVKQYFGKNDVCLDIVKMLLSKGANCNIKNKAGMTPLQFAVGRHDLDLLRILKEHGADFSVLTKYGENLLHLAYKNYHFAMVDESSTNEIISFLVNEGCAVNAKNKEGYTPLNFAVEKNKSVDRLIKLGADVNCQTKINRKTPLHHAVQNISWSSTYYRDTGIEIISALLHAGASCNVTDSKGRTPLNIVLGMNESPEPKDAESKKIQKIEVLKRILQFGPNINDPKTIDLLSKCGEHCKYIFIRHLGKLRAIGSPIEKDYESYRDEKGLWRAEQEKYLEEVKKLKTHVLRDGITLYHFFHMDWHRQLNYVDYLPEDLKSKFPCYANFILSERNEAMRKKQLLRPVQKVSKYQDQFTSYIDKNS